MPNPSLQNGREIITPSSYGMPRSLTNHFVKSTLAGHVSAAERERAIVRRSRSALLLRLWLRAAREELKRLVRPPLSRLCVIFERIL